MATKKVDKVDENPFAKLTWDDLSSWAGSTIMDRGRSYKQNNHVRDLAFTPSNALIAWVDGTERYATTVEMQNGELASDCSCPYGATCKHAVAVVLEYLDYLKNKKTLPKVGQDDKRLQILSEDYEDNYSEDEDDDYDDDQDDEEEWEDEDEDDEIDEKPKSKPVTKKSEEISLKSYLEKQTKKQLISLIEQIASQHPAVKQALEDTKNAKTGKTDKIVQSIRNELSNIEEPRRGYDNWADGMPDWDRIKAQLTALLQSGHADEVLDIGQEILEEGNRAIESYDQEGEVGDELSECMKIVFQALPKCSLSLVKQLQWINEITSEDEYGTCDSGIEAFWQTERKKTEWNTLANELKRLLDKEGNFSSTYKRDRLTNRLITVLEKAERTKEIIPLCEHEAVITGSYQRLIAHLINDKRWKEADGWCRRGIEASEDKAGINSNLRNMLRTINEETGNYLVAAAISAELFFVSPDLGTFQKLCESALKAGVKEAVEAWARHYLETGEQPQTDNKKSTKQQKVRSFVWPLPETGLKTLSNARQQTFPIISTLINIAIAEKKSDEVLKWFDHSSQKNVRNVGRGYYGYGNLSVEVAEAVKESYPDRAIAIWKEIGEGQIALTDVKAYVTAGNYLRKVRDVLINTKREKEWQIYLAKLQQDNKRKPRCIQVLNGLSGKPIIDS